MVNDNIKFIYSLTPMQEGMLYHNLVDEQSTSYVLQTKLRMSGNLNIEKVKESLSLLAEKYDILRTSFFYKKASKPWQVVLHERKIECNVIDLLEIDEKEKEIGNIQQADIQRGFDLEKDSLLRVTILKESEEEHILLWSSHHIIIDGWSLSPLFRDFFHYYEELAEGKTLSFMQEKVREEQKCIASYGDYINWIERQDKEEGLCYWANMLEGYNLAVEIPPFGKSENKKEQVKDEIYEIDTQLSKKLQEICTQMNVTISTMVETVWGILLQKYNQCTDVVFGKVVSGRNADIQGIEQAVGLFINTIPCRVKCEGSTTVKELIEQMQQQSFESMKYDYCPLAEVQSKSELGSNLIKTLFVFENYYIDESIDKGIRGIKIHEESSREQTNYSISMSAFIEEALKMKILYAPDKYTTKEIKTLLGRMELLLQQIAEQPEKNISELSVLDEEEKKLVVETFNDTAAEYPSDKTVVELLEEQVYRTPDNIAVVFEKEEITYAELNARANQLAYKLRGIGVRPDDRVAIIAQRSIEMIIGIFGITKAGGAYVPIDPDYPEERIRYMLEDCQPKAVLAGKAELQVETDVPIIDLFNEEVYKGETKNPLNVNTPDNLVYIIYTSGTTGKPKGVMIEHKSIIRLVKNSKDIVLDESTVILQTGALSFDASTFEIWGALLNGGKLYLVDNEILTDSNALKTSIQRFGINTMWLTAALFNQMISENNQMFDTLKYLLIGGEKLSEKHVALLKERNTDVRLINGYGPTENTTFTTMYEIPSDFEIIPIGKPIAGTQIYIMNGNELCGIGMPGELCIAGAGLARGYLNQPELTEKKFIKNPFGEGKIYRSGDLSRWLPDGNIEFMGRMDEQIKIRGFRIELGEIESVLRKQNNIKDVVVTVKEKNGDKSICAYVVSDEEVNKDQIKDSLRKELPEYMVPAYIMKIQSIPATRNGKLDKRALPEPEAVSGRVYIAPGNEMEEAIAGVFEQILEVTPVGIEDNFFEIGGHSLRATRVVNQIEAVFGVRLLLKTLFKAPTVKLLAKEIEGAKQQKYIPIPKAEEKEMYAVSSAQKRLYLIDRMHDTGTTYNIPMGLKLQGKLDIERLKTALESLTERHEALRTSFHIQNGEMIQKVSKNKDIALEYEEWTLEKEDPFNGFIRPFNLEKAPLMRVKVIKSAENQTILMLDMHHVISDGMSMGILLKELSKLYNGEELEPLRVQYKDYSEWMRKRDFTKQKEYWREVFIEQPSVLNLPVDHSRLQVQSYSGGSINSQLSAKQKKAINELCLKTGTTAYIVLLSAVMVLLGKYSRQEDIVIGSPISGRTHKDTEHIIGMFVNTLAMRGYPKKEKKYLDFLNEVKESALKAYENQEYPFEELVEELKIQRDLSRNPLFDVMFVMQNNEHTGLDIEGIEAEGISSEQTMAKFDLTISITETEDGYGVNWEFCADLFKQESIKTMQKHFSHLVDKITGNPEKEIRELGVVDEDEKMLVVETFNDTAALYPSDKTVVELFEEQVSRTPDNIAVVFEEEEITYAALNAKANQLAYALRKLGVKPDDRVAIIAQRSIEMIIGIYGIIKAGGAYVPIDPDYPEERIRYTLEDCQPKAILVGKAELQVNTDIPMIDLFDADVYTGDTGNPVHVNKPKDLVYIIYTSGTTGKPKGVMIEHRNVVRLFRNDSFQFDFKECDVWLMFHSYCFDFSVWEMYGATLFGGKLITISNEVVRDTYALLKIIETHKITVLSQVPSAFYNLIRNENDRNLHSLKYLIFGGEALQPKRLENWHKKYPDVKIVNMYGITETTVHVTYREIQQIQIDNKISDIGKAIPTLSVYILNGNELCGIGMPGELCVAGEGLARGYLNQPELTAKKFVKNPFGQGRIYRSGDLARWLPDGNIEYMGRIDEQVKIRGFRIELGEIESVLRKQSTVRDVVVTVSEKNGDRNICAYLVSDEEIDISEIKNALRKELPEYMVPAYLMRIDSIPVTRNGKLDKRALSEPEAVSKQQYIAPRNRTEETIAGIFEEILEVTPVGIEDNFFEIGGHSLRATRVVNQIEANMGIRLPLKTLFRAPTVKLLAKEIEGAKQQEYIAIPKAEEKEIYAVSSAQKRLYLINQMYDTEITYNMPLTLLLKGNLDIKRLKTALEKLTERHEALRTSFHMQNGQMIQIISKDNKVELEYEEQMTLDEDLMSGFIRPFNLEKAPLMRVKVIKSVENQSMLMFDMHHIISDGMSMNILTKELSELYNGKELKPLTLQYKDYSEWIRTRDLSQQKEYWKDVFEEPAPILDLPVDHCRPQTQSYAGSSINSNLTAKQKKAINQLCSKTGATAYMVLLSAVMVLLGKYSRQEDIVVGSPISGRTHKDTEQMLGVFINTLAMRGYPKRDKKYLDFLKEVKEISLKAYENQEYPFEELVEELKIQRDLSRNPLFDVMFVMQNNERTSFDIEGLEVAGMSSEHTIAKFDMTISITETEDGYEINWEYCTDLFEQKSVKRMQKHFSHLVNELISNPEKKISELSVLDEEEKELVVESFNDTAAQYPSDKTVVELLEEQVSRTPDNIAVVFEEEEMTYAELNSRANQLAYKLREIGVRPDDRVAIIAQRSIEMIIGIYGIIKAGGAYVPIDPDYPEERIRYMLEDCQPKAVLAGKAELQVETDVPIIDLFNSEVYKGETKNPLHVNTPDNLVYIIYTSGTTGKPKGVMIEHKSIIRLVKNSKDVVLDESTVILQTGALSFDASTFEIWGALLNGGKLYLVDNEILTDSHALKTSIQRFGINTMWLTAALYNQMISEDNQMFDTLKYLLIGGEKLSEKHVALLKERNTDIRLINGYGPTENTTFTTMYEIPSDFEIIPIGKPIAGTQIYIMNGNELCGIGVPGELCIAGAGLARGYLNQPELTEKKFIKNQFGGGKIYRSGDLARWLPDGNVEFMGRIDEQIKIRGFRIELGEIESVLRKQNNIKDVVVTVKEKNGDKSICAYVVSDEEVNKDKIKDNLRKELPDYMVPAYMMQIRSIPVTRNGKVDKCALPEPEVTKGQEYIVPTNTTEGVLAGIFEEILGVTHVGSEDNFFEMGGDSIKAIRVVSKMREAGYLLTVKDLMQLHIVKLIAEKSVKADVRTPYYQGEISGQVPLTPIQHMFFSCNYVKENHFNQAFMVCCKDGFDTEALKESLKALVIHHDVLRSVYSEKTQRILSVKESRLFDFKQFDIRNSDNVVQIIEKESTKLQSSIDIENGPLLKVGLFNTENGDHLLLCLHHLVVDGVSWRIILEDLTTAYEQSLKSKKIILPEKAASYKDWAEALIEYAESKELKKEIKYWNKIVQKADLGRIRGDLSSISTGYDVMILELDQEITYQLLYEAGKAYGTEINDLLLSALGMAVKQWNGQNYLTVELEGHGREEIHKAMDIDRIVGWFTSIYPIVLEVPDTTKEMIISTKEMLRGIPNHGAGYIVAKYIGKFDLPDVEADICFNYLGHMDNEFREDGLITASNLPVGLSIAEENTPKQGITMNGSVSGDKLKFDIAYDNGRYSEQNIEQFCKLYIQSIKTIVQHCKSQKEIVKTASDFGAIDMSNSDFELLLRIQDK